MGHLGDPRSLVRDRPDRRQRQQRQWDRERLPGRADGRSHLDRGEDSGGGRVNRRGRHAYHRGQAQATQPSAPIFTGGVWAVPSEVKPGVYATAGAELCYWARLRDAGDPNSIIVNSFGQAGRQRMTIRSSDGGFQSRDFGEWRKVG